MWKVYAITQLSTGQQYVGITKNDTRARFHEHFAAAFHGSAHGAQRLLSPLAVAMRAAPTADFSVRLVDTCSSKAEVYLLEQEWIAGLRTMTAHGGFNRSAGGPGTNGYKFTDEQRGNLRALRGFTKTPEYQAEQSTQSKKTWSDEGRRAQMSTTMKKARTPELIAKTTAGIKANWADPEWRAKHEATYVEAAAKMRTAFKGHSAETKERMRASQQARRERERTA